MEVWFEDMTDYMQRHPLGTTGQRFIVDKATGYLIAASAGPVLDPQA